MHSKRYKYIEFLLLFIVIPTSFVFNYSAILKLVVGVLGFFYVLFILLKVEKNRFKINKNIHWNNFWKSTFLKFLIIAIFTATFVYFTTRESLFTVAFNKPILWILILFFYSLFSVYPQELLYRTFFFDRYKNLFKNELLFIIINAFLFSLAHLFFKNGLVLIITFIGGIIFAFTYKKTQSTVLVSIEHAIYGCWLFTVGMGEILGFPS